MMVPDYKVVVIIWMSALWSSLGVAFGYWLGYRSGTRKDCAKHAPEVKIGSRVAAISDGRILGEAIVLGIDRDTKSLILDRVIPGICPGVEMVIIKAHGTTD